MILLNGAKIQCMMLLLWCLSNVWVSAKKGQYSEKVKKVKYQLRNEPNDADFDKLLALKESNLPQ